MTFVAVDSNHVKEYVKESFEQILYRRLMKSKIRNSTDSSSPGHLVEQMPFEEVDYWDELTRIMDWTKTNVVSVHLHLCWGAQAGMYYHYGIR